MKLTALPIPALKKFIDKTNSEIDTLITKNTILYPGTDRKEDWDRLRKALSQTRTAEQRIRQKNIFPGRPAQP